jgi:hypothetical protein
MRLNPIFSASLTEFGKKIWKKDFSDSDEEGFKGARSRSNVSTIKPVPYNSLLTSMEHMSVKVSHRYRADAVALLRKVPRSFSDPSKEKNVFWML